MGLTIGNSLLSRSEAHDEDVLDGLAVLAAGIEYAAAHCLAVMLKRKRSQSVLRRLTRAQNRHPQVQVPSLNPDWITHGELYADSCSLQYCCCFIQPIQRSRIISLKAATCQPRNAIQIPHSVATCRQAPPRWPWNDREWWHATKRSQRRRSFGPCGEPTRTPRKSKSQRPPCANSMPTTTTNPQRNVHLHS